MSGYPPGALAELTRRDEADEKRRQWRKMTLSEIAERLESMRELAEHYSRVAEDYGYDDEAGLLRDVKCDCKAVQDEFRS